MRTEGGFTSIIDLCADKLAEEALVGGREKDREPHANKIVAVVEQFGRHLGVLSEIEPCIDHDPFALDPRRQCQIGATLEKPHNIGAHTVGVDGLRVGHSRADAHMGSHDRCVVPSGDREKLRIGETADVVADVGADLARLLEHRCPEGVDRDRQIEALPEGLDGGHHAIDLLLHGDLGTRTGLRAADIEEIGPLDDQLLGLAEELIEGPVLATVEEGIRRAIEDSHHECTRRDVETGGAELDEHHRRP